MKTNPLFPSFVGLCASTSFDSMVWCPCSSDCYNGRQQCVPFYSLVSGISPINQQREWVSVLFVDTWNTGRRSTFILCTIQAKSHSLNGVETRENVQWSENCLTKGLTVFVYQKPLKCARNWNLTLVDRKRGHFFLLFSVFVMSSEEKKFQREARKAQHD